MINTSYSHSAAIAAVRATVDEKLARLTIEAQSARAASTRAIRLALLALLPTDHALHPVVALVAQTVELNSEGSEVRLSYPESTRQVVIAGCRASEELHRALFDVTNGAMELGHNAGQTLAGETFAADVSATRDLYHYSERNKDVASL